MALSLHTTKKYDVQYGRNAINGWGEVDKFLQFLRQLQREDTEAEEIFINEEETEVEIPFTLVDKYRNHEEWGDTFKTIWEECDRNNEYAFLNIW